MNEFGNSINELDYLENLLTSQYSKDMSQKPFLGVTGIELVAKSDDYSIYCVKGSKGSAFYRVMSDFDDLLGAIERTTLTKEIKGVIKEGVSKLQEVYAELRSK